jgi:hypothetical protein
VYPQAEKTKLHMADSLIFYDRTGAAIAYALEDGVTLYTYSGRPAGYIHENGIFSFDGIPRAWYLDGWVLENDGSRLFFTKHAKGGPVTPIKGIQPIRGIRKYCPGRKQRGEAGLKPAFSLAWSARSGLVFFEGPPPIVVKAPVKRPPPAPAPEPEALEAVNPDAAAESTSDPSGQDATPGA